MASSTTTTAEIRTVGNCFALTITRRGWLGPWQETSVHTSLIEAITHIALARTSAVWVVRGEERSSLVDVVREAKKGS